MRSGPDGKRALIIRHMKPMRGDLVSGGLMARGFELDYRCPAEGEALPGRDEGHALAVVYGGVQSANDGGYINTEIDWIGEWVESGGAYLGLCLGGQLLARALGARVAPHAQGLQEIGFVRITPGEDEAFLPAPLFAYQWHKEGFELPREATPLAFGEVFPNQAFRYRDRAYALQFHPEVTTAIMLDWMTDSEASLSAPGASPRARQLKDAGRYGADMEAWLEGFLDRCLLPRDPAAQVSGAAGVRSDPGTLGRR